MGLAVSHANQRLLQRIAGQGELLRMTTFLIERTLDKMMKNLPLS